MSPMGMDIEQSSVVFNDEDLLCGHVSKVIWPHGLTLQIVGVAIL